MNDEIPFIDLAHIGRQAKDSISRLAEVCPRQIFYFTGHGIDPLLTATNIGSGAMIIRDNPDYTAQWAGGVRTRIRQQRLGIQ